MRSRIPSITAAVADRLADVLGDLPLAVAQAVAYVEQTETTPADYLEQFVTRRSRLLTRGDVLDYGGRIDTTWDLSLDRLLAMCPTALALLKIGAFLAPEPIPLILFGTPDEFLGVQKAGTPDAGSDALNDAIGAAVGFSLIHRHPGAIQLHRLVQAVIRNRLPATEHRTICARVAVMLTAAHPGDPNDTTHWPRYAQLAPHLLVASRYVEGDDATRRPILDTVGYLISRGEPRASQRTAEELLGRWRCLIGPDHPDTLSMAIHLTLALIRVNEANKARQLAQDTLPRARQYIGPDHPDTLRLATYLAMALAWVGEAARASALVNDTFPRFFRASNPDHPEIVMLGAYLARALAWVGNVPQAHQLSEQIFARAERTLGPLHITSLFAAVDLAFALLWLGEISRVRVLTDAILIHARNDWVRTTSSQQMPRPR